MLNVLSRTGESIIVLALYSLTKLELFYYFSSSIVAPASSLKTTQQYRSVCIKLFFNFYMYTLLSHQEETFHFKQSLIISVCQVILKLTAKL